jgi:hypothetical protein
VLWPVKLMPTDRKLSRTQLKVVTPRLS